MTQKQVPTRVPFEVQARRWTDDGWRSEAPGVLGHTLEGGPRCEIKLSDDLVAEVILEEVDGEQHLRSLQLATIRPGVSITTAMLREISAAELVSQTLAAVRAAQGLLLEGFEEDDLDYLLDGWSGARERDEVAYAALAWAYIEELRKGERKPSEALATRLGFTAGTTNQRVREARLHYKFLTPAPAGKAGGQLTDRAKNVLARWADSDEAMERRH